MKRERVAEVARVLAALAADEAGRQVSSLRRGQRELPPNAPDPRASAVRHALEQLGPFYIKVGQMLSTRPDLVSQNVIEELQLLHDRVSPAPFSEFEPVVAANLGEDWRTYFSEVDTDTPIGTASLAQVYSATLKNGEDVVIKVRRPGIADQVLTDMEILERALRLLAKRAPALAEAFDPEAMLETIFAAMRPEIDFTCEASNMEEYRSVVEPYDHVAIPEVIQATEELLILTRAPGTSVRYCDRAAFSSEEREAIGRDLIAVTCRSFLVEGFFHADPHPGNVFVAPGEPAHLIDFGMMGRFDRRMRDSMLRLFMALGTNDGVGVARTAVEIGRPTAHADLAGFVSDIQRFVPTVTSGSLEKLNFGVSFTKILVYFRRRGIVPSPALALMGKAISNIEGSTRYIAPELSILDVFEDAMRPVVFAQARQMFSEEELMRTAMDAATTIRMLPEQIRLIGQEATTGGLPIRITTQSTSQSRRAERSNVRAKTIRNVALATAAGYFLNEWRRRR